MKTDTYTLNFLTPCFCAGADQSRAEIRPTAIRGQLRWWFRALGGSPHEERDIFGGIAKKEKDLRSSSIAIQVFGQEILSSWTPPTVSPNNPDSYVWYFASVSGKEPGSGKTSPGPRWTSNGAIAPKTKFKFKITYRREIPAKSQKHFDNALLCFLTLGGIGLRVTRGLGAFSCDEHPINEKLLAQLENILSNANFHLEISPNSFPDVNAIAGEIGSLVKGTRKKLGMKFDTSSPFGSSDPRQTSAIYFRPYLLEGEREMGLIIFEAPHEKVLGEKSRVEPILGAIPSKLVHAQAPQRKY
jgi:hypothetical protein